MNNSICVKVCEYDINDMTCKGCNRTAEEITEWYYANQERKREIAKLARERGKAKRKT